MTSFEDFNEILKENNNITIFLFTADWCRGCNKIKPLIPYNKYNILDIVVDESFELFAKLKLKNVVKQIPTLLAYRKNDLIYQPSDYVSGTNEKEINDFFERCKT